MALSSRGAAKGDTSLLAIPERFFLLLSQTEIIFCCSVVTLTGWVVLNWLNFVYMLWRVFFFLDSDLCKTTVSYRSTLGETLCSSFAAVMGIYNVRFWHILPHLKSPVLLSQASSFGYILFLLSSSLALFPNRIKLSWWLLRASYPTVLLLLVFLLIAPVLFLQKPPTPKENHRPNNGMDGSLKTSPAFAHALTQEHAHAHIWFQFEMPFLIYFPRSSSHTHNSLFIPSKSGSARPQPLRPTGPANRNMSSA